MKEYIIPNNWLQTNIFFAGLNHSNPEQVIYEYRIKEQDTSWVNPGNQNFINLIGLRPGTCTPVVKITTV